jgi:hypothetical protein
MQITKEKFNKFKSLLDKANDNDVTLHFILNEDLREVQAEMIEYLVLKDHPDMMKSFMNKYEIGFSKKTSTYKSYFTMFPMFGWFEVDIYENTCPNIYQWFEDITSTFKTDEELV